MRILHLADLHIKLSGPRAGECRRILGWIADHVAQINPNAIIVAGDIFDARSTPEERLFLAEFLEQLRDVAPVYAIHGNHDNAEDVRLFNRVCDAIVITESSAENIFAMERTGALFFLPWPKLANLAAELGPGASIAERREIAKAALIDILRGFRSRLVLGSPSLLVAHIPVSGASMDSGQPVSGGDEIALSADELLECGAAGVALGHVHLRQQMKTGSSRRPVWYAGAPFRNSFGEASGAKGGLIWDWDGKAWQVTPWDVPARDMLLLETTWENGQLSRDIVVSDGPLGDIRFDGAEIRLRVSFPPEEREAARAAAEVLKSVHLAAGAYSVTVEERPIQISRTRCVEIQKAKTTFEKLKAWAEATGQELPAAAETRVAELEAGGAL